MMMMWGFHQQLQLSVEWYNITAVSVVFCQLVKVDKLSLSDRVDDAEGNDVKRGNSESVFPAHLRPQTHKRIRIPQTNCAKLLFLPPPPPSIRLIFKPCNLILLLPSLYIIFVYKERAVDKKIIPTLFENESMWNMMLQYYHSKAVWRPDLPQMYWHSFSGKGLIWLAARRH